MWERGLKFTIVSWTDGTDDVVPLVGTWIEICKPPVKARLSYRRSPCGNVD